MTNALAHMASLLLRGRINHSVCLLQTFFGLVLYLWIRTNRRVRLKGAPLWVGSGFIYKYLTRLEMLAKEKRSSLSDLFVSDKKNVLKH
jgi:hypothetical protein